jgi:hypothetical protein
MLRYCEELGDCHGPRHSSRNREMKNLHRESRAGVRGRAQHLLFLTRWPTIGRRPCRITVLCIQSHDIVRGEYRSFLQSLSEHTIRWRAPRRACNQGRNIREERVIAYFAASLHEGRADPPGSRVLHQPSGEEDQTSKKRAGSILGKRCSP